MPACMTFGVPRSVMGQKRCLRDLFGAPIDALKDMFQVSNLRREVDEMVHQIWWYTGDVVCTSRHLPTRRDVT